MTAYEVFVRGVVPNVIRVTAASPLDARRMAEDQGHRVKFVKPARL
jgi:hypothetical protein